MTAGTKTAKVKTPKVFYHGTDSKQAEAILKEGLIPGRGKGGDEWSEKMDHYTFEKRPPSVYLARHIEGAEMFAAASAIVNGDKTGTVLRVVVPDTDHLIEDEIYASEGFRYEGKIPASAISVKKTGVPLSRGPVRADDDFVNMLRSIAAIY